MSVSVVRNRNQSPVFGAVRFWAGNGMVGGILPGCDGEFFERG
jgi:hypothetical protein